MTIVTRLIPALIGITVATGVELALKFVDRFVPLMALTFIVLILLMMVILRRSTTQERMMLLTPPVIFYLGLSFALFFLSPAWLRHSVIAISSVGLLVFAEEVFRYIHEPALYHQHAIEHLSSFLGITAMALSMSALFALRIFLNVRLVYLLPLSLVVSMLVSTSVLVTQSLTVPSLVSTVIVFSALIMELTWAVHFLPTSFLVNSAIVTVPFYVALNLVRHELNHSLTKDLIRRYTITGLVALFLVLVTSQWII